jgi:hypothetical protein
MQPKEDAIVEDFKPFLNGDAVQTRTKVVLPQWYLVPDDDRPLYRVGQRKAAWPPLAQNCVADCLGWIAGVDKLASGE